MTVREEPFHLTDNDSAITEADGTANSWTDIWDYQVPPGMSIKLSPEDRFSLYLEDTSPAEVGNQTCEVEILVRDAAGTDNKTVYGPALYFLSKEFQEGPKVARLSGSFEVSPRERVVVRAKDDGTIDASDSYFELLTTRISEAMGV